MIDHSSALKDSPKVSSALQGLAYNQFTICSKPAFSSCAPSFEFMKAVSTSALHIRFMKKHELAHGIEWAAHEGWNPRLNDSETFFETDPQGFLLAEIDQEPVGMISCVRYGLDFGFIGFFIVTSAFRGRGHGLALWQAAVAQLGGRLIGLDGVVAQQANYRKAALCGPTTICECRS